MVNSFSWSCLSCGEYNVVDLTGRAAGEPRCEFCFQPVQAPASLDEAPRVQLSDDWLGDEIIEPLFGKSVNSEG